MQIILCDAYTYAGEEILVVLEDDGDVLVNLIDRTVHPSTVEQVMRLTPGDAREFGNKLRLAATKSYDPVQRMLNGPSAAPTQRLEDYVETGR